MNRPNFPDSWQPGSKTFHSMTNYIIVILCLIVLLSYLFDITSRYSRIPGVVLLIGLGILLNLLAGATGLRIPNFKSILPVIGTLGLILIVMDASLDLKIERDKKVMIGRSIFSAIILFGIFTAGMTVILVHFMGHSVRDSMLNSIPLGIISSAVAIPASRNINPRQKEFIVYESAFSDIIGIMVFDIILVTSGSFGNGLFRFGLNALVTLVIAIITTSVLAMLLHKIKYHVNYVIIMTAVVMVYALAKIVHLPALLLVLCFGMALSNSRFVEHTFIKRFVDFEKFRNDLESFRRIAGELTFLVRSFFFIIFGFYTSLNGMFNPDNLITALSIAAGIFLLRAAFFIFLLRSGDLALIFFAPRGLITILLFMSIPSASAIPRINAEVITLVILLTLLVLIIGNFVRSKN